MPLHSRSTFFYKWIFPSLWSAIFGLVAVTISFEGFATWPSRYEFAILPVAWLLGGPYMFWFAGRLRMVTVDADRLVISDGRGRAEYVPVSNIVSVHETRFWNPRLTVIQYSRPSGHLGTARVLQRFFFRWPVALHPDVRYLRERVEAARQGAPSRQRYGRT